MNFIKFKNLGSLRNKRIRMHAMHWEIIFTNHISDKEFISRIYKKMLKTYLKKGQLSGSVG